MGKLLGLSKRDGFRVLMLVLVGVGCATATNRVPPRQTTSLVISPTQRILVAGFVTEAEASTSLDFNAETVRLVRDELRRQGALGVIRADPVAVASEAALADREYWRILGEEHGAPLIVTGAVRLRRAPPNVSQRGGRGGVYQVQPGFLLEMQIVLIDGATGDVVASERMPRKAEYGSGRAGSPSVLFYSMMYGVMPNVVRAVLGNREAIKLGH